VFRAAHLFVLGPPLQTDAASTEFRQFVFLFHAVLWPEAVAKLSIKQFNYGLIYYPLSLSILPMSLTVQAVNVALAVLAIWLLKKVTEKKPLGRPIPGPKGWPIIGNLLDVPTKLEYQVFSRWQKKYGTSRMTVLTLECNNQQLL